MNPCLNDGICQSTDDGYVCHCKTGYGGINCEQVENPCSPNPCQNGGNCTVSLITKYQCTCAPYYGGINCTIITDLCATHEFKDFCLNNGTCSVNGSLPVCRCSREFSGRRCEKKKSLDFNVMFYGNRSQDVVSNVFLGSILKRFTLCFWIRTIPRGGETVVKSTASFLDFKSVDQQRHGESILSISTDEIIFGEHRGPINITENVWQQFCFRSHGNSTVNWMRNGAVLWSKDWSAPSTAGYLWILLGSSRDSSESFEGALSMVQLYDIALSNQLIDVMANNCLQWLHSFKASDQIPVVDWDQFSGIERGNRIFPGICTISECLLNHEHCNAENDKVPPQVIDCPSNVYVTSPERLSVVTWSPSSALEMFRDTGVIDVSSNYNSGDVFTWGEYHVMYVARDDAGNIGVCQFDVVVAATDCPYPARPDGGNFTIQTKHTDSVRKIAFVECSANHTFIVPVPAFYTCDLMGRWIRWPHGIHFYFPSCSPYTAPLQHLDGSVTIMGSCNELNIYEKNLREVILKANQQFGPVGFCSTANCSDEIRIWPNSSCTTRVLRNSDSLVQEIELIFLISVNTTRKSISPIVNKDLEEEFGREAVKSNTYWQCPSSNFPVQSVFNDTYSCVECQQGQYCLNGVCASCPENTYKNTTGCGNCTPCPTNTVTGPTTGETGYHHIYDCYTNCSAGHYYSSMKNDCLECAVGQYQPYSGQLECYGCPLGSSTATTGSISVTNCTVHCPQGTTMNVESKCVPCQRGTYREENSTNSCSLCPTDFTTESSGCISLDNCTVPNCPPGTYLNLSLPLNKHQDICTPCAPDFCQNIPNQTQCERCPEPLITQQAGCINSVLECMMPFSMSNTTSSSKNRIEHHSPSLWIFAGCAGALITLTVVVVLYVQRRRIRILLCAFKETGLERIATFDYYRDSSITYPIVTVAPAVVAEESASDISQKSNLEPQKMADIFQEIYSGLHSMAEGAEDRSQNNLTFSSSQSSEPLPTKTTQLAVDTSLRAEYYDDPKALGMDSSGFPIDSADYDSVGQLSLMDSRSCTHEEAMPSSPSVEDISRKSSSVVVHRPFTIFRNWHLRVPSSEVIVEPPIPEIQVESTGDSFWKETDAEDTDDEDYFA